MKSPYSDDAPPPSYSEQAYDRKISPATAILSQTQITPNQWETYSPAAHFEDVANEGASAYGQPYAYRTAPVKDSAQPLPYKNAAPTTPLRIIKPSEFKANGFYVENQNSPLSPDDDVYTHRGPAFGANHHQIPLPQAGPPANHHTIHPSPEQWGSASESSQRPPIFDTYGAMSAPTSQYPAQPQTPRRPLPPRPSQAQHQSQEVTYSPMSPHPSQPSHLTFDPSSAYARSATHSSAYSAAPYNALSLYNSAVSAQMTTPRRNQSDAQHPVSARPRLNDYSPSRMRPDSIYSVASSRVSADDSDRFSEYSHHSSANSVYSTHSSTPGNPWYPNRK